MDRSEPSEQPAKKRQRLSEYVDGDTDGAEPMVLANGNAGLPHRQEDDRVGPRKLIPRCQSDLASLRCQAPTSVFV